VKAGHALLEEDLDKLYKSSDYEDEYYCLHVTDAERIEKKTLDGPGYCSSEYHYEYYRNTHRDSTVELLGYTKEGADTEESYKYVVICKNCGHYDH